MALPIVRLMLGVLLIGVCVLFAGALFNEGELNLRNWAKGLASMIKYLLSALLVIPFAAVACVVIPVWWIVNGVWRLAMLAWKLATAESLRDERVKIAQQMGMVAVVAAILLVAGLSSGRPPLGECVAVAKLVAIATAVVATLNLRDEWVAGTAILMTLPMLAWGAVLVARGKWAETAMLAATLVLTIRLGIQNLDSTAR